MHMNSHWARIGGVLLCAGATLWLSGCATLIAPMIVAAQPGGMQGAYEKTPDGRFILANLEPYIAVHRRIPVGPPNATLAVDVIPPGNYALRFGTGQPRDCTALYLTGPAQQDLFAALNRFCAAQHHTDGVPAAKRPRAGEHSCTVSPNSPILDRYRAAVARLRSHAPPKGTIILLPGYGIGKLSMLPWALLLGQAGYQSILVDTRAQGQSTGHYVTYGALESRDLLQLIAALREAGLIQGRLGLLGESMGAATALLAAAHLHHVAAVVAISPYARATEAIPRYARLAYWYAPLIPSASWRAAEHKAGQLAGVSLAEADPINVAARIRAPVLYIQGGRDKVVSAAHARQLAAHTPDSHLMMFAHQGHIELSEDFPGLAQPVINWFNRHVARDHAQARPPPLGRPHHEPFSTITGCVNY